MRRVALDTNLLVLLCVGSIRRSAIAHHKRTRPYSAADSDALIGFLSGADRLVTTPYVVAEVSNLLDRDPHWPSTMLPVLSAAVADADELSVPSTRVLEARSTAWLGVTDAGWVETLDAETLLVTDDARLANEVLRAGKAAALFRFIA